jgi:aminoglycoside 6'-N-acetyltransferase
MRLRRATLADLALLRRWDELPHIVNAHANGAWGGEPELARTPGWREQLIAELDGRALGFVQIIDPAREDSHYWGDIEEDLRAVDLWIGDPDDLGRGHGTMIMRLALERCFANPRVLAVLADPLASNTRAHRFFEKLGFKLIERRSFGDDDCHVYRLKRPGTDP